MINKFSNWFWNECCNSNGWEKCIVCNEISYQVEYCYKHECAMAPLLVTNTIITVGSHEYHNMSNHQRDYSFNSLWRPTLQKISQLPITGSFGGKSIDDQWTLISKWSMTRKTWSLHDIIIKQQWSIPHKICARFRFLCVEYMNSSYWIHVMESHVHFSTIHGRCDTYWLAPPQV